MLKNNLIRIYKMKKIIILLLLSIFFVSCSTQTYVSSHSSKLADFSVENRTKMIDDINVLNNIDDYCVVFYNRINLIPIRKAPSHIFRLKKCNEVIIGKDTIVVKY